MSTEHNSTIEDLSEEKPKWELQPCDHMVSLVSQRSDGSLSGPAKWYTDFHVMTCPHCRGALKGLRELRAEVAEQADQTLKDQPRLTADDWQAVEKGWNAESDQSVS